MTHVIDAQGRIKVSPGFPVGAIIEFYGTDVPDGWAFCDGTGGTIDLRDRFLVGDDVAGVGTAAGTTSFTAGLTHTSAASAAHSNHGVTQPSAHADHSVTQPIEHTAHGVTQPSPHGSHSTEGAHTHDAYDTATRTAAGVAAEVTTPATHASQGGHAHDAHSAHTGMTVTAAHTHTGMTVDVHSAHSGMTVDAHSAHSVTQASAHSVWKYYLMTMIQKLSA